MMRQGLLVLLAAGITISCVGCQAARVQRQGLDFRQAVTAMYADQLMDTLVRAWNDEPFVLLRYRDLLVDETDVAELAATYGNSTSDVGGITLSSASLASQSHTVGTSFSLAPKISRTAKMSFQADPLVDRDETYDRIIRFAKDPSLFKCEPTEPHPGAFHPGTKCKRNGLWYFVPGDSTASEAFMRLALAVSFSGPKTTKGYYEVTVSSVVTEKVGPLGKEVALTFFMFDQLVPNDNGFLVIPNADPHSPTKIEVGAVASGEALLNKPTRRLVVFGDPTELKRMEKLPAHLYLFANSPELAKTSDRLEQTADQIRATLNRIQGQ